LSSGFAAADLESFFDEDGVGVHGLIFGPASFELDIKGVFDLGTQHVSAYAETGVDTDEPTFECVAIDLVGVTKGMTLAMPDLEAHEDGFGLTYEIMELQPAGVQTTRLILRAL
jgi:hypothetical protein